jgi:hypothetical protein
MAIHTIVTDLQYPIGRFSFDEPIDMSPIARAARIDAIARLPERFRAGFVRFKLALTEEVPTIRPFDENAWSILGDVPSTPIGVSFDLLDALHARWVVLLRSMSPREFARTFVHPAHTRFITLDVALALYAWHGEHHLAHVRLAR